MRLLQAARPHPPSPPGTSTRRLMLAVPSGFLNTGTQPEPAAACCPGYPGFLGKAIGPLSPLGPPASGACWSGCCMTGSAALQAAGSGTARAPSALSPAGRTTREHQSHQTSSDNSSHQFRFVHVCAYNVPQHIRDSVVGDRGGGGPCLYPLTPLPLNPLQLDRAQVDVQTPLKGTKALLRSRSSCQLGPLASGIHPTVRLQTCAAASPGSFQPAQAPGATSTTISAPTH